MLFSIFWLILSSTLASDKTRNECNGRWVCHWHPSKVKKQVGNGNVLSLVENFRFLSTHYSLVSGNFFSIFISCFWVMMISSILSRTLFQWPLTFFFFPDSLFYGYSVSFFVFEITTDYWVMEGWSPRWNRVGNKVVGGWCSDAGIICLVSSFLLSNLVLPNVNNVC